METSIFYTDKVLPTYKCGMTHHKCRRNNKDAIKQMGNCIAHTKSQIQQQEHILDYLQTKLTHQANRSIDTITYKPSTAVNSLTCTHRIDYENSMLKPMSDIREYESNIVH